MELARLIEAAQADEHAAEKLARSVHLGIAEQQWSPDQVVLALLTPLNSAPALHPIAHYCQHACNITREMVRECSPEQHQLALRVSLVLLHLRPEPSVSNFSQPKRPRPNAQLMSARTLESASRLLLTLVESSQAVGASSALVTWYSVIKEQASVIQMVVGQAATPIRMHESLPSICVATLSLINNHRARLSALVSGSAAFPSSAVVGSMHWAAIALLSPAGVSVISV